MVTRHLDGYPLWPTRVANPRMPADYRSRRDLVGDLTAAVHARGLRMGLYYAGGVDWTFTDRPIRTMVDLMADQALGPVYARYAEAQVRELVETYGPSILWNDMGWPAESDPNESSPPTIAWSTTAWSMIAGPRRRCLAAGWRESSTWTPSGPCCD